MTVELFRTTDRARMDAAIAVRIAVFVDEQRIPLAEEIDAHDGARDTEAVHALARDDDGTVLGTGRYYREDADTARIGRLAVHARARGRGVGRTLLDALTAQVRRAGYARAVLNAQEHAIDFYARAGFVPDDETNVDGGIVHRQMRRVL